MINALIDPSPFFLNDFFDETLLNRAQQDLLPPCFLNDSSQIWRLTGEGIFSWTVFNLYRARLFVSGGAYDANQPFILDLCYLRTLPAQMIISASLDELKRLRNPAPELLQSWSEALRRIVPDVGLNDRLVGHFIPGKGVRFYSSVAWLGEMNDPLFAEGFAAIWLDPATGNTALREALLGLDSHPLQVGGVNASA